MLPAGRAAYHALLAATYLSYMTSEESYYGDDCKGESHKRGAYLATGSSLADLNGILAGNSGVTEERGATSGTNIGERTSGVGVAKGERQSASAGISIIVSENLACRVTEVLSAKSVKTRTVAISGTSSNCSTGSDTCATPAGKSLNFSGQSLEDILWLIA